MSADLRGLARVLSPVGGRMSAALLLGAVAGVAGVIGLVLVADVLRVLLVPGPGGVVDAAGIATRCGGALLAGVARAGLRQLSIQVSHLASYDLEVVLRSRLAEHLGRVPLGEVARLGSGRIKTVLLDDVRALHAAVADIPPLLGAAVAAPVAATVALLASDWRLALAALGLAPVAWLVLRFATADSESLRREWARADAGVNTAAVELAQGMPVVRTFDTGAGASARFRAAVEHLTDVMARRTYTSRRAVVLTRLFLVPLPTLLVVLVVGVALVQAGSVDLATLVAALVLGAVPVEAITPLAWLLQFLRESAAAAARIEEVTAIDAQVEPQAPRRPVDGSVSLRGVRFGYGHGRAPALDGIDLDIADGTICALVGASGAGKSTVARLIARFADVDAGVVRVGGADVRDINTATLLGHVALVFQEPFLVHDTIAENIRMARPTATDGEIVHAARAAQADAFIRGLPAGYATVVGERGASLSGGQRQRITIARALLSDARVVILDEATAFADPQNEAAIQDAVGQLCQGRTLLVIAHRLATIVDADQIVVLDHGRVAERGRHHELLALGGHYARMWAATREAGDWALRSRP